MPNKACREGTNTVLLGSHMKQWWNKTVSMPEQAGQTSPEVQACLSSPQLDVLTTFLLKNVPGTISRKSTEHRLHLYLLGKAWQHNLLTWNCFWRFHSSWERAEENNMGSFVHRVIWGWQPSQPVEGVNTGVWVHQKSYNKHPPLSTELLLKFHLHSEMNKSRKNW